MFPVVRVPMEVHYGKDEDSVRFYTVEDTVRKAIGEATANVSIKDGPGGKSLVGSLISLNPFAQAGMSATTFLNA